MKEMVISVRSDTVLQIFENLNCNHLCGHNHDKGVAHLDENASDQYEQELGSSLIQVIIYQKIWEDDVDIALSDCASDVDGDLHRANLMVFGQGCQQTSCPSQYQRQQGDPHTPLKDTKKQETMIRTKMCEIAFLKLKITHMGREHASREKKNTYGKFFDFCAEKCI